jgi:hypothetical protein
MTGRTGSSFSTPPHASCRTLSHGQIVAKIEEVPNVSGWWAQSIAVAYERHIGRRLPGQSSDGTFSATLSRTFAGGFSEALSHWIEVMGSESKIAGRDLSAAPATSDTRSGLNWRCKLDDGSRVAVNFLVTKPNKTRAGLQHDGLSVPDEIDKVKACWAGMVARLVARLVARFDAPSNARATEYARLQLR